MRTETHRARSGGGKTQILEVEEPAGAEKERLKKAYRSQLEKLGGKWRRAFAHRESGFLQAM